MAAPEMMDPDFTKALRLMFSTSKDASETLRSMVEEAIRARYGSSKSLGSFHSSKIKDEDDFTPAQIKIEHISDDSNGSKDEDDGALDLDMIEEDLTCNICRGIDIAPRNRLIECLGCHNLFHQECHRPPISDQDVSDPRNAWYCGACSRNMLSTTADISKQTSSKSSSKQSSKSSSQSGSNRDSPTGTTKGSLSSRTDTSASSLFKRSDKVSSGLSTGSTQKSSPSGLAALAASLQSGSKSSSSSHKSYSSSSGSKSSSSKDASYISGSSKGYSSSGTSSGLGSKGSPSSPTMSGLNADKRLQIMKKKAAKMQEKRKHSK